MIIIDTNTGQELTVGVPFRNIEGTLVILDVEDRGFGKAKVRREVLARNPLDQSGGCGYAPGDVRWVPLIVRYTHPGFFLRRVGFYPS